MNSPDFDWQDSGKSIIVKKDGKEYKARLWADDAGFDGNDEYLVWVVYIDGNPDARSLYEFDEWDYLDKTLCKDVKRLDS